MGLRNEGQPSFYVMGSLNGTLSHLSPENIISKHHFSSSLIVKVFPKNLKVDLIHLGNVTMLY